jgi:hypothetical protein
MIKMSIKTKFGNCNIDKHGYYIIGTRKEGNENKRLHRLIYEDFWGVKLPSTIHVHHIDGNPLNNCILNLEALTPSEHMKLHMNNLSDETLNKMSEARKGKHLSIEARKKLSEYHKGKPLSEETKAKISKATSGENNPFYGKHHTEETKRKNSEERKGVPLSPEHQLKMSKSKNTSGYYRIMKHKTSQCTQGFNWVYNYYIKGKRKSIYSVDIDVLERKVKSKGLPWINFNED